MEYSTTAFKTGFNNRIVLKYPSRDSDTILADVFNAWKQLDTWDPTLFDNTTAYQDGEQVLTVHFGTVTSLAI